MFIEYSELQLNNLKYMNGSRDVVDVPILSKCCLLANEQCYMYVQNKNTQKIKFQMHDFISYDKAASYL